jgi:hypothetical protein
MKLTSKHKVKDLPKFTFLLEHSDTDLMKEVAKFDLPMKIGKEDSKFRTLHKWICKKIKSKKVFEKRIFEVKDFQSISIGEMMEIWDISNNEQLVEVSARIFLGVTDQKKISNLPLIDFLRLMIHLEKVSKMAANEFKKLNRENKDPKLRNILSKYKGSDFGMIARFCKLFPIYTLEQAKNISWVICFKAFEEETKSNDIQTEINESYKS